MFILGLTGSIGMGKSVAAGMFRRLGVPVHESDAAVHQALSRGGSAVSAIAAAFPGVVRQGAVDRGRLAAIVIGKPQQLRRLEAIVHPLVYRSQFAFLAHWARQRAGLVVLDIPLLFETGGDKRCDAVAVISAPHFLQRQRVLRRPRMTERKFAAILREQMADSEKRRRADFVIPSGLGRRMTWRHISRLVKVLRYRTGRAWPRQFLAHMTKGRMDARDCA